SAYRRGHRGQRRARRRSVHRQQGPLRRRLDDQDARPEAVGTRRTARPRRLRLPYRPVTDAGRAMPGSPSIGPQGTEMTDTPDTFASRHIGPNADDVRAMLDTLGHASLDQFIDAVVPEAIRLR